MRLSAPTKAVYWLSVVSAVLGFVFALGVVPGVTTIVGAIVMLAAFVLLAVGCAVKGM
ncbi:MAG: hypothetical protein RR998_00290 [Oscillospiraceae bacterium]